MANMLRVKCMYNPVHASLVFFTHLNIQNFSGKIAIIFLSISLNMCFGCSKEPSHQDDSFEYPQHMFWLK